MPTPVTNFGKATVSIGYDETATSVVLATGHGSRLPSTFPYPLTWWNATDYPDPADDTNREIVIATGRTGDTLTVTRAGEGTSASTKNTSGKTYKMVLGITKAMWDAVTGLVLIQTQTAANVASVDFTTGIDSTYNEYLITLTNVVPVTNNTVLMLRVSQDGGATFKAGASDYAWTGIQQTDTDAAPVGAGDVADAQIQLASALSTNTVKALSGEVRFFSPSGTARNKQFLCDMLYQPDALTIRSKALSGLFILNQAAIDGIRFFINSGNIAAGVFTLYGVRR